VEDPGLRALRLQHDSVARGLLPPPRELTAAERATVRAFLRDSLGISWQTQADGTVQLQAPPALERAATGAVKGLLIAVLNVLVIVALIYLPIPVALTMLTVVWWLARWRHRRRRQQAPRLTGAPAA
jgi:Flp pilus assembly protein TadB